jgi:acetyl-CoA acyltransferase
MSRTVVLVDAVRTPFGKAGGMYAGTRADDLMVRAIRGLSNVIQRLIRHQLRM